MQSVDSDDCHADFQSAIPTVRNAIINTYANPIVVDPELDLVRLRPCLFSALMMELAKRDNSLRQLSRRELRKQIAQCKKRISKERRRLSYRVSSTRYRRKRQIEKLLRELD